MRYNTKQVMLRNVINGYPMIAVLEIPVPILECTTHEIIKLHDVFKVRSGSEWHTTGLSGTPRDVCRQEVYMTRA